ncbi:MAG: cbb3-type cytochrome c oxidase subunit I [Gammaproteobacteria bacterium]|nr:cbb3-type cytochrome c oxidase subunit I [Gammaproteobacteria bacterium]
MIDEFKLEAPKGEPRRLAIGWLLLALGSLVVGGLFTILIVLSRTPFFQEIIPWVDFFHIALVVHVDLTVLVWFLAFAGVFWSINGTEHCPRCGWVALLLSLGGAGVITIAPFLGAGNPFMNNYVPVLQDPIFLAGLAIFGAGFALLVVNGLLFSFPVGPAMSGDAALRFGLFTALISAILALFALGGSYVGIPESITGEYYYELLFWGGGHLIQITHTQLMLVAWLWLATATGLTLRVSPRVVLFLFAIGLLPALLTPFIYYAYEVTSAAHLVAFTRLMEYGGGLAALPLSLVVILGLVKAIPADSRAVRSALLFSIILFGVGGIIGFLIRGSNVTIPAHYHGSIVAVTLAYMGITYHILPQLGFRRPTGRLVDLQPTIYASGQLLHVLGLAWSGGYGVKRKTAGAAQGLESIQQVAGMGMMGLGGLIAIIGGILFLVVVFMAMWKK